MEVNVLLTENTISSNSSSVSPPLSLVLSPPVPSSHSHVSFLLPKFLVSTNVFQRTWAKPNKQLKNSRSSLTESQQSTRGPKMEPALNTSKATSNSATSTSATPLALNSQFSAVSTSPSPPANTSPLSALPAAANPQPSNSSSVSTTP